MRRYASSFLCLLLELAAHSEQLPGERASSPPGRPLCWQEGRQLRWADFRAKDVPRGAASDASESAAISATSADLTPLTLVNGTHTYAVRAVFWPDSSWLNARFLRTEQARQGALAHEQLHFDIAELTARRLRQCIAHAVRAGQDLFASPTKQKLAAIRAADELLNNQFDEECFQAGNAREAPVRQRWRQRLARELAALAAYKSTPATCPD